jgi:hypothetical protein
VTLLTAAASLDVTGSLDVGAGNGIILSSGNSLTAADITLAAANSLLQGTGIVTGALSGPGEVLVSGGGSLRLETAIGNSTGVQFTIGDDATNVLQVDASIGAGNTFTFQAFNSSFTQTLVYNNASPIAENIVGLDISPGTTPANVVDFKADAGLSVVGSNKESGTSGTISLSDGSTLTLTGITDTRIAPNWFAQTAADGAGGTEIFLSAVCYVAGTRILTDTGERAIENLSRGDTILTLSDNELKPRSVRWVGHRRIDLISHPRPETLAPVRVQRGAFADNTPHTDLLVSPDHAIFTDGKLICARQLVNGTTIVQERDWAAVEYHHVELDQHAILMAEGLPAESYLDTGNHGFFANSGAPLVLHPDLTDETGYPTREAGSCAPFVCDEASVRTVWQRLAERAAAIGRPVPRCATTMDPDVRLLSDRRTIRPIFSNSDLIVFPVPRGAREVGLVSRGQSPIEARPWLSDRRRLGVRVKRIVLRGADGPREVPVDHPDLSQGWWAVERDGKITCRWTDGDARLPLPAMSGTAMLEIHLAGSMIYAVDAVSAGKTEQRALIPMLALGHAVARARRK